MPDVSVERKSYGDFHSSSEQNAFENVNEALRDKSFSLYAERLYLWEAAREFFSRNDPAEGQTVVNNTSTQSIEELDRLHALGLANEHAKTQGDTADNTIKRAEKYLAFLKGEGAESGNPGAIRIYQPGSDEDGFGGDAPEQVSVD